MTLSWREASDSDIPLLAEWNHRLIRDSGHRNPMTVAQLSDRMREWLKGDYKAIVFSDYEPVAYALFKSEPANIYLRQFFVRDDRRKAGVGTAAFQLLQKEIWRTGVRLTVDVLCRNAKATRFWHKVGYQDYCLTLEIMPSPLKYVGDS
jgi:GNAT superfamily N-acetyltransferase